MRRPWLLALAPCITVIGAGLFACGQILQIPDVPVPADAEPDAESEAAVEAGAPEGGCGCGARPCCGSTCAVRHDDGLGGDAAVFYDCIEAGAYGYDLAWAACGWFTGDAASFCSAGTCGPPAPATDMAVCSSSSQSDCVCWTYAGPDVGFVYDSQEAGVCLCAIPGNPQWN